MEKPILRGLPLCLGTKLGSIPFVHNNPTNFFGLRSSIQQALNWSRIYDFPLNACKSPPDHCLVFAEEAEGKLKTKCEQFDDLGITVNAAFTPSANAVTAANKARGMLYIIKR